MNITKKKLKKKNFLLLCMNDNLFLKRVLKKEINEGKIHYLVIKNDFFFYENINKSMKILCSILNRMDMVFLISNIETYIEYEILLKISKIINDYKILSVFIKTQLFDFIGKINILSSKKKIMKIYKNFHAFLILSKKKLLKILGIKSYLVNFINLSNNIAEKIIRSIVEPIIYPGSIKITFSDIYMIIFQSKYCAIGFGSSSGIERAKQALNKVYENLLLENIKFSNIKKILINVTSNSNINLHEFEIIKNSIYSNFFNCTHIVIGTSVIENEKHLFRISIIVTQIKFYKSKKNIKNKKIKTITNNICIPHIATICSKNKINF